MNNFAPLDLASNQIVSTPEFNEIAGMPASPYVMLYDSLMKATNSRQPPNVFEGMQFIGEAFVAGRLYKITVGTYVYPGLMLAPAGVNSRLVKGELYQFSDPRVLNTLDYWEGCNYQQPDYSPYLRKQVQLHSPNVVAWVYVGNHPLSEREALEEAWDWKLALSQMRIPQIVDQAVSLATDESVQHHSQSLPVIEPVSVSNQQVSLESSTTAEPGFLRSLTGFSIIITLIILAVAILASLIIRLQLG